MSIIAKQKHFNSSKPAAEALRARYPEMQNREPLGMVASLWANLTSTLMLTEPAMTFEAPGQTLRDPTVQTSPSKTLALLRLVGDGSDVGPNVQCPSSQCMSSAAPAMGSFRKCIGTVPACPWTT